MLPLYNAILPVAAFVSPMLHAEPPAVIETFDGKAAGFADTWTSADFAKSGEFTTTGAYAHTERVLAARIEGTTAGTVERWMALTVKLSEPLKAGYRQFSPINHRQHWNLGFYADKGEGKTLVWNGREAAGVDATAGPMTLLARIRFDAAHYTVTAWAKAGDGRDIDVEKDKPFGEDMQFAKVSIEKLMFNGDKSPGVKLQVSRLAFDSSRQRALVLPEGPPPPISTPKPPTALSKLLSADTPLRPKQSFVFFGDSITEQGGYISMFRQLLDDRRPDLKITLHNKGHSGYKVPDIQPLLQKEVIALKPTAVVIYIGINDVWHWKLNGKGTTKENFEAGLRDMVARCKAEDIKVILATPSVVGEKPRGQNELDANLDEYAKLTQKVGDDTGCPVVDLRAAFFDHLKTANPQGKDRGVTTTDGVHMLPAGDEVILRAFAEGIAKALEAEKNPAKP